MPTEPRTEISRPHSPNLVISILSGHTNLGKKSETLYSTFQNTGINMQTCITRTADHVPGHISHSIALVKTI